MNAVFQLEVTSFQKQVKILLVLHQWANCSTEQPRCSKSYFYINWFMTREQQTYFSISKVVGIKYITV